MDTSSTLHIKDFLLRVGGKVLLSGVDLDIRSGDIIGIAGSSGSGKTALAWTMMSLPPSTAEVSGSIELQSDGNRLNLLDTQSARTYLGTRISIVPQDPFTSLNPSIKCGVQITENWQGTSSDGEAQTLKTLRDLRFEDPERIMDSFPHQLSGGQLQRVVIAMAIINSPEFLIADEATTALDTITTREVLDLMTGWSKSTGAGLVLISHDTLTLTKYCDRVYTLSGGKLNESIKPSAEVPAAAQSQTPETEPILQVNNISKSFLTGKTQVDALKGVSFNVYPGEGLGIIGSSGSGKSTIARLLVGLEKADAGTLTFNDTPIDYTLHPELRGEIQMIFQDPYSSLYPHKTAGYCIEEAVKLHTGSKGEVARERTHELLETVGLAAGYYTRSTRQLSGGERQRVQIARALAVEPSVLICDECTSGLDAPVQARILGLLAKLRSDGLTVVFISHDLHAVRFVANQLVVLHDGGVVEKGNLADIISSPKSDIARVLMNAQD